MNYIFEKQYETWNDYAIECVVYVVTKQTILESAGQQTQYVLNAVMYSKLSSAPNCAVETNYNLHKCVSMFVCVYVAVRTSDELQSERIRILH